MTNIYKAAQQALEALIAATPVKAKDPQMQADAIVALRTALAEQPAEQEPVAAQHRFRHPQKGTPDWSVWQPCKVAQRPAWEVDSQGYEVEYRALYTAPQPAIPPGYKLVPEVPTNEWINNLARRQTGSFEKAPFAEIHQCIAELLESAPEAPKPAKQPLTDVFLRKLHHIDEFGLFCDYDDFEQIARAIERAHGIGEQT